MDPKMNPKMNQIIFVDVEVDPGNDQTVDFGAVRYDRSTFRSGSAAAFAGFMSDAKYICGHNILEHDLNYISGLIPDGEDVCIIDTLSLSPLLFPLKPYHALLKDDKLQTEELNNPLNDAKKSMELFMDEMNAWEQLSAELSDVYRDLLKGQREFSGFFRYIEQYASPAGETRAAESSEYAGARGDVDRADVDRADVNCADEVTAHGEAEATAPGKTPGSADTALTEAHIRSLFAGQICDHSPLRDIISNHPVELAYCLALISADDRYSMTPQWVHRSYPAIENVVRLLRNNPCEEGCPYCDRLLDVRVRLKTIFGYDSFRTYDGEPLQEMAAEAAVKNRSLLAIFPTAGGKSLTFQLPALIAGETSKGLTVVISPLQSLMKDQVDNLAALGIADAVAISGLLSQIERAEAISRIESGLASILYISPESLRSKTIEKLLLSRNVVRFVIDEAHCFSSWGQDFRVDYLYIGDFISELQKKKRREGKIPVSCFTATAKQKVISDIKDYFKQKLDVDLEMYTTNAERSNLRYEVLYKETDNDKYEAMRDIIIRKNCPTIVYVSRIKRTREISERLCEDGFAARPYNGKMDPLDKIANQEAFLSGETQIIVATTAFGMGVDKRDVGLVIHFDISDSLENYVQEAGRAGRDQSLNAECYVLFQDDDLDKHFILLNQTKLSISEIQQVWKAIKELTRRRDTVSRSPLEIARLAGWDDGVKEIETRVKTAIAALETAGYVKRGMNVPRIYATSISAKTMTEASEAINNSARLNEAQKQTASRIMSKLISSRSRAKAGSDDAESRVDYIADTLGLTLEEVIESVSLMREDKLLEDMSDMSAFIHGGKEQNRSADMLRNHAKLERFLASIVFGSQSPVSLNLKDVNGKAELAGIDGTSVKTIRTILYFWIIRGYIRKTLTMADDRVEIEPEISAATFRDRYKKRVDLAVFIIRLLFSKIEEGEQVNREEVRVPFSVIELKAAYEAETRLFDDSSAPAISDVEDALLYMSVIRALNLEGGFLVLYSAMEIQRLRQNNKIRYKDEDYKRLNEYYQQKIQQIHIVGEYANMMTRDYDEALQFVNDYFRMDYKLFIEKYFNAKQRKNMRRNITPQKYERIFGELSDVQEKIISDDSSKYIVAAAGPGSGKTRVLVHKLASLILLEDVKTEQMLMLTFSRAAATVFKKQLQNLIGGATHYIDIMTFHSYCFGLLGKVGSLEDSDEVVSKAVRLIKRGEAEPGRITRKVVVIDEAQDMSEDEFELVKALMDRNEDMRIIAVGDDDQNIYEFRGSDSKYLESLVTEHGARMYELLENYRSRNNIAVLADEFVRTISKRMKSNPVHAHQKDNGVIGIVKHKSGNLEIPVVENIKSTYKGGSACVLTKTNDEALLVLGLLVREGYNAKLIQSNDGFNLPDLAELRFFIDSINRERGLPVIPDDVWASSIERLRDEFSGSECLTPCLELLEEFDRISKVKYRTDLEQFILESKLEDVFDYGGDEIIVSTIHKAKGREFDSVYMLLDDYYCGTDEKKRQLYVGMTRAKENLYIHYNNNCFDGFDAPGVQRHYDQVMYPQPGTLISQLSHREVNLGYFKYRSAAVKKLKSGCELEIMRKGGAVSAQAQIQEAQAEAHAEAHAEIQTQIGALAQEAQTGAQAGAQTQAQAGAQAQAGRLALAQETQTGAQAQVPGAVTGLSAEILGRKQEVLRFSKSFLSKVEDLQRRGYAPESAKIRFIVSWKDKDNESEHDVILPDVRFKRTVE